jgi:GAF domain-containing protein
METPGECAQHRSELQKARAEADAARAEVEVVRKTMVLLARDGRMDEILDALLGYVQEVVPYTLAAVLFDEEGERWFVAREWPPRREGRPLVTVEPGDNVFLQRVVVEKKSVHVPDTRKEADWQELRCFGRIASWIGVPLVVGERSQGVLSLGSASPGTFTKEHVRLTKLLAIPFAVAVDRARLYEWSQIYAHEREDLIKRADAARKH